ncbi:MAG: VCBS repeat-containing protein [Patescibacteria group bacterium]
MKFLNEKITPFLIVIIIILSLLFYIENKHKINFNKDNIIQNQDITNINKVPELTFGQITRKEVIDHVNYFFKDRNKYARNALEVGGKKKFIIGFYQPNYRDLGLAEEDKRAGIMVFEVKDDKIKLIWESTEKIVLVRPTIELKDITGDGKVEILSIWSDGKISMLYIYSWDGKTFKFITPLIKVESEYIKNDLYSPLFGASGDIQIKDSNHDGLDDILLISPKIDGGYSTSIYSWDINKKIFVKIKELTTTDPP